MNEVTAPADTCAALRLRQRVARAFARQASHYDAHAGLQRAVADALLTLLPALTAAHRVLDLGCGTGYLARAVQGRAAAEIFALDLALPMLQQTAGQPAEHPPPGLVCADAEALPLATACCDLVVSSLAMQWCPRPQRLLAELARVLRPGGNALLTTLGPATLQELRSAWQRSGGPERHNRFESVERLRELAGQAGLEGTVSSRLLQRYYADWQALMAELRGLGATTRTESAPVGLARRDRLRAVASAFDTQRGPQGVAVTWEVITLQLRKH
ncbi:MAG: malonyl-ACP O-methyltransferase BioC [Pseudohongiellaceae bacterium]